MKIIVATESPGGPKCRVAPNFGSAPAFTIFESRGFKAVLIYALKNPHAHLDQRAFRQEAQSVKNLGAKIVVAGRFCTGHSGALENAGIKLFRGRGLNAQEAAEDALQGKLEQYEVIPDQFRAAS